VPEDKLSDSEFIALRDSLQGALADPQWQRAFAIHEAAHVVYFPRAGANNPRLTSANITYDSQKDKFNGYAGAVSFDGRDQAVIARLTIDQWLTAYAMACAAGGVAARLLTDAPDGGDEGDFDNLCKFCDALEGQNISPGKTINRTDLWIAAQDAVRKELTENAQIRALVEQAAEIVHKDYSRESE